MKYAVIYIFNAIFLLILWTLLEVKYTVPETVIASAVITLLCMGSDIVEMLKNR